MAQYRAICDLYIQWVDINGNVRGGHYAEAGDVHVD
jgi:hypothetical protein